VKRIFFDTLVFLMGSLSSREPYSKLFRFPRDRFELILSDSMFTEVLDVLRRSTSLTRLLPTVSQISLQDIFASLHSEIPSLPSSMKLNICRDEGDNKFLASAIYLECDLLVTAVPDLLQLEKKPKWQQFREKNGVPVRIVDPASFVAAYR
jgi:putative PIN family toxin of toxin-antitoxin system